MVKITIITPVYNLAHLIAETISSVLRQSYPNWEMIIVDDGSTDNLREVVRQFSEKDSRIQLYHQPNSGASVARNTGIRYSNYGWLLFLDADDWIAENYFDNVVKVLEHDESVDVLHCGWTRTGKEAVATKANYGGEEKDMFPSLSHYCPFAIHSCIVRKSLAEQVGGFDGSFKTCGDWDFWQRVARTGARFKMVKEVMAFYRTTANSLSSDGNQFCIDGLQVISQAYSSDPRVRQPKPVYRNGLPADDLCIRQYYFVTWCGGLLIGTGKSATPLLHHLNGIKAENLDAGWLAETLWDSLMIPVEVDQSDWHLRWQNIMKNLAAFLDDLENQSQSEGLATRAMELLERHIIGESMGRVRQLQIGKCFMLEIDIESPVLDVQIAQNAEGFFGVVRIGEMILGMVELPVTNARVPSLAIKEAIASKFSWQILRHFFSLTIYLGHKYASAEYLEDGEFHDKMGWEIFLQQLWQKPGWTEKMFYDPTIVDGQNAKVVYVADSISIEVSESIPVIKTKTSSLSILYFAGGALVGRTACKVYRGKVFPQMIRAAINLDSGYEICRVVVREALIGEKMDIGLSLPERLIRAKNRSH